MRWLLWCFCLLAESYETINHYHYHNLNRKDTNRQTHSGRPKSSRTLHSVAAVRDSVVHSPSTSVRRRSQELGINRKSVRRILISDLHMDPYRIQIKQKLTPDDMRKLVIMCQWCQWFCVPLLTPVKNSSGCGYFFPVLNILKPCYNP